MSPLVINAGLDLSSIVEQNNWKKSFSLCSRIARCFVLARLSGASSTIFLMLLSSDSQKVLITVNDADKERYFLKNSCLNSLPVMMSILFVKNIWNEWFLVMLLEVSACPLV